MVSMINFPENFNGHMRLGQQFFQAGSFNEAKEHFTAALDLEDSLEANNGLVKTLLVLEEYQAAKKLCQEKLADYLADETFLADWLTILLKEKKLQATKRYLLTYAKNQQFKEKFLEKIVLLDSYLAEFETTKIKETLQKVQTIPADYQWPSFFAGLDSLPIAMYLKEVRRILADDTYPLMLRNKLLAQLRQAETTDSVVIRTLFETKEVIPNQLPLHGTEAIYREIMQQLREATSMLDVAVRKQMITIEQQYLWLLYPEVSQINSAQNWLHITLHPYKHLLPLAIEWQEETRLEQSSQARLLAKVKSQLSKENQN